MTFLEHLEEMRWRIIKALAAVLGISVLAFIESDLIMGLLTRPAEQLEIPVQLQAIRVSDLFMVQIIASFLTGLVLASPVILYQLWRFIRPALEKPTRTAGFWVVVAGTSLFVTGVLFGYLVILPFSLRFFSSLGDGSVASNYSIQAYFGYVAWILLSAGLIFQLPVISFILTRIGLLTPAFLRHYRKFALIGILVLSAILTPPDPLSQILMAIPLLGLYEVAVLISKIFSPSTGA